RRCHLEFKANIPIYLQVYDLICDRIIGEQYLPGDKLPSVRELAEELTTNPRTIQSALKILINHGILITQRGQGNFISQKDDLINELRQHKIQQATDDYVNSLVNVLTLDEILIAVTENIKRRKHKED
ncbi:GntR family transcriptional regulator, partial [Periweissella beninensis]|uniref:GntR family transcriptional regulator n=1 Tax=Periweissella beninensis TaxID=504936 RepID=UPI00196154A9